MCKNRWQSCAVIDWRTEESVRDLLFHIDYLLQSSDCERGAHLMEVLEREKEKNHTWIYFIVYMEAVFMWVRKIHWIPFSNVQYIPTFKRTVPSCLCLLTTDMNTRHVLFKCVSWHIQFIGFRSGKDMNYTTESFQHAAELNVSDAKWRHTLTLKKNQKDVVGS